MERNPETEPLACFDTNLQQNTEHNHGVGYLPGLLLQLERPCSSGAHNWSEAHCLVDTGINRVRIQTLQHPRKRMHAHTHSLSLFLREYGILISLPSLFFKKQKYAPHSFHCEGMTTLQLVNALDTLTSIYVGVNMLQQFPFINSKSLQYSEY
jgi:hypothetical protein